MTCYWLIPNRLAFGPVPDMLEELWTKFDYAVVVAADRCEDGAVGVAMGFPLVVLPLQDDARMVIGRVAGMLHRMADAIAHDIRREDRVILLCNQGINRSALLAGLVLLKLHPELGGPDVVRRVREARPEALANHAFAVWLASQ